MTGLSATDPVLPTPNAVTAAALERLRQLLLKSQTEGQTAAFPEEMYVERWDQAGYRWPTSKLPSQWIRATCQWRRGYVLSMSQVLGKWLVKPQNIVELPLYSPRPPHLAVGRWGVYRIAWGEFSISADARFVDIGCKASPGTGRGHLYRVTTDASNKIVLQWLQPFWLL